jgi:hypothetical protein
MHDDMANVVTERPRRGHRNKSKKTTGRRIWPYHPDREYDEPTRLPVARGRQYGYSNDRTYHLSEYPIDGLYVHPKTGLIREQRRPMRNRVK